MNIKPVGKRILVKVPKPEEKKIGNLFVAGTSAHNDYSFHEIIDIGDEVTKVQIGQKAFLPPYGGFNIADGIKIVEESDVIAIERCCQNK